MTLKHSDQKNLQILLNFYFINEDKNQLLSESLIYLPFSDLADDDKYLGNV